MPSHHLVNGALWDVTVEVIGNVMTTSGTINTGASQGEIHAASGSPNVTDISDLIVTGAAPWNMTASTRAYWTQILAMYVGYNTVRGVTSAQKGTFTVQTDTTTPFNLVADDSGISGSECVTNFTADTQSHGGDIVLANGDFTAIYVFVHLNYTNLVVGTTYEGAIDIYRRLQGSSDDWVFSYTITETFTADSPVDSGSDFPINQGMNLPLPPSGEWDGYEYQPMVCRIAELGCGEYQACYDAVDPFGDAYSLGYNDGYSEGYGVGFNCDPAEIPDIPTTFNCPPDATCELGTEAGELHAYYTGYQDGYIDGWNAGRIDGECPP